MKNYTVKIVYYGVIEHDVSADSWEQAWEIANDQFCQLTDEELAANITPDDYDVEVDEC